MLTIIRALASWVREKDLVPIIWGYLLRQYLKVLTFSVVSFLVVLFVCQLRRLAQFALLGAGFGEVVRFGLYLIPYVLPIAVPIGCLIASILLFGRLSQSHELVSLRASGLGMRTLLAPLLLVAAALSLGNFYVASELATHCHLLGIRMKTDKSSLNPLLLLQNTELLCLGDVFLDMRTTRPGEEVRSVALAWHNSSSDRLDLLTADRLYRDGTLLRGDNVHVIAPIAGDDEGFDRLIIENQDSMQMQSKSLAQLLGQVTWRPKNHYLRLKLLLLKLSEDRVKRRQATSVEEIQALRRSVARGKSEIVRRLSISCAALTFTLMGCVFGIDLTRRRSNRGVLEAVALAALFLACFLTAAEVGELFLLSMGLYLVPHGIIGIRCLARLRRISHGSVA